MTLINTNDLNYRSFVIQDIGVKPLDGEKPNFQVNFSVVLNPYDDIKINKAAERFPICFDYVTKHTPNSDLFFKELWLKIIEVLAPIHDPKKMSLIVKINKQKGEAKKTEDDMEGISKFLDFKRFLDIVRKEFGDTWQSWQFWDASIDCTHYFTAIPMSLFSSLEASSLMPTMMH